MKYKFLSVIIIITLIVIVLAACAKAAEPPSADKSEAEILIDERCSERHSSNRVYFGDDDSAEWSDIFDEMIDKGANINDAEKSLMIDWLVSGN